VDKLICTVCNKDCLLLVSDDLSVTGNLCPEGAVYAMQEIKNPVRTVTSTVKILGALHVRCPVKSLCPIDKSLMFDAIKRLDRVELIAPVESGEVVISDICGTGVAFVTTRSMSRFV